jgi:hypothetical protein
VDQRNVAGLHRVRAGGQEVGGQPLQHESRGRLEIQLVGQHHGTLGGNHDAFGVAGSVHHCPGDPGAHADLDAVTDGADQAGAF